jgi:hypothetical protein
MHAPETWGSFYESILTLIATDIFDITSEELASLAIFGNVKPPIHKYYLSFWTQDNPDDMISEKLFVAGIEERGPEDIWYAVCTVLIAPDVTEAWNIASKLGLKIVEQRFIKEKPFSWSMNGGKTSESTLKRIDFLSNVREAEPGVLAHDADHVPEQSIATDDWLVDEED